jgi:CRISPR-associated protein Cas2
VTMTLVVTRNVPERFRGFLASVMCEVTLGVYTAPKMTPGVRDRVWKVMEEWFDATFAPDTAVVMTWPDAQAAGGQAFRTLGVPKVDLHFHDGVALVRCELTAETRRSLTTHEERNRGASR